MPTLQGFRHHETAGWVRRTNNEFYHSISEYSTAFHLAFYVDPPTRGSRDTRPGTTTPNG